MSRAHALDTAALTESKQMRRWLLLEDFVLVNQACITVGAEVRKKKRQADLSRNSYVCESLLQGLAALAADYVANGALFEGAQTKFLEGVQANSDSYFGGSGGEGSAVLREAHALLERSGSLTTRKGKQLQWVSERQALRYSSHRSVVAFTVNAPGHTLSIFICVTGALRQRCPGRARASNCTT